LTISQQAEERKDREFCRQFQWNEFLTQNIVAQGIDPKWVSPMIRGYIGFFQIFLQNKILKYYLIARRSRYMAGNVIDTKGIDDDGQVANFIETEQLLFYKDLCLSHIQIRGSVPLFWSKSGSSSTFILTRPLSTSTTSFMRHVDTLKEQYGALRILNLLNPFDNDELLLTESLEKLYNNNKKLLHDVYYERIDTEEFNKKSLKFAAFIGKLRTMQESFKFWGQDISNPKLKAQPSVRQTGTRLPRPVPTSHSFRRHTNKLSRLPVQNERSAEDDSRFRM
jgi:hypothetical protein